MIPGWQDLAALALVALSAAYLLRQGWRLFRRRPGGRCGGCTGCASGSITRNLTTLEIPPRQSQPKTR